MKKDEPAEVPELGTAAADKLIDGVLRNLCAEGSRGDVVSKLVVAGKLRMPGEQGVRKPTGKDEISR